MEQANNLDTYFDTAKCVERLFDEWNEHKRLIIASDFDDTIFDFHGRNQTHKEVVELLQECKKLNFYVVMFTASKPERYPMIKQHMSDLGVEIDGINKNVIELKYGNNGKIYFNILLDDRAGLFQAVTILKMVINKIKNLQ